ncbi:hypothetical protein [Halothece sp. PCC 7418]|nr:hypothetical protein [Halothece sp. PCC 7418]
MTGFSISAIAIRRHIGTLAITVAVLVIGNSFGIRYGNALYCTQ